MKNGTETSKKHVTSNSIKTFVQLAQHSNRPTVRLTESAKGGLSKIPICHGLHYKISISPPPNRYNLDRLDKDTTYDFGYPTQKARPVALALHPLDGPQRIAYTVLEQPFNTDSKETRERLTPCE